MRPFEFAQLYTKMKKAAEAQDLSFVPVEDCKHENRRYLGTTDVGEWWHCDECGTSGVLPRGESFNKKEQ